MMDSLEVKDETMNQVLREKSMTSLVFDSIHSNPAPSSEKEIADILHISEKTIRNIEAALYQKLNDHSMSEAIIYATNHRMIFT